MSERTYGPDKETRTELNKRWARGGLTDVVKKYRRSIEADCKRKGMKQQAAYSFSIESAAKDYPRKDCLEQPLEVSRPVLDDAVKIPGIPVLEEEPVGQGLVEGLDRIPKVWGELPASGTLKGDLEWVNANRLKIVRQKSSGGVQVLLRQSHVPAPSWSALSWLQLAISNPAKFMDLVAKNMADEGEEDGELVRRERKAIGEIRGILERMEEE